MRRLLVLAACLAPMAQAGLPVERQITLTAFPPESVTLLPGPLLDAQERNRHYLQSLDPERLLHNFRVNAGLASAALPLGGWEKPDCELRGHFVGHYLTACALIVQSTGDPILLRNARRVVQGLDRCQQALGSTGYLSAFPEELLDRAETGKRVWAPWYTLHKIYQGLVDMAERCGDTTALRVLHRALGWVKARTDRLGEPQMQATLRVEFGGMGEMLVNAYRLTGNREYLELARRFDKQSFTRPLAHHTDQLKGLHANTHIPQAIAAARLHEVTGERDPAETATFFWEQVVASRTYVTGGTSNYEHWRTDPGMLAGELSDETHENCCAYNLLRLTRLLQEWKPQAARGDYYERALYNGIHPTQHPRDGGGLMYFVPMRSGLFKMFGVPDSSFWCCNGTGIESFGTLNAGAFYHDSTGVLVDLFIPARVTWKQRGISILVHTRYPEEETVRFVVRTKRPARFALRVRVPGWIRQKPAWRLNGVMMDPGVPSGSYASIERMWNNGDSLSVTFPMGLRLVPLPGDSTLVSILYGPVVLAGEMGVEGMSPGMREGFGYPDVDRMFGEGAALEVPVLVPPTAEPADWIVPAASRPLTFATNGACKPRDLSLIPFARLFGERYAIYFRIQSPAQWKRSATGAFPSGTVDSVRVGDVRAEEEHNFQAWRYTRGGSAGGAWVTSPLWLRYDMNVGPENYGRILLTIDNNDSTDIDLLLDGMYMTTLPIRPLPADGVRTIAVPLDEKALAGKRRVAVMVRGRGGLPVPRIYGISVRRSD